MTGALRQVAALLGLRWHMLRTPGAKAITALSALTLLWLMHGALASGELLEEAVLLTAFEIAPGAVLGFGILALIAPLTAGGGHEIVPTSQLVAYPVRARTQFICGLLLAPVNLVWALQVLVLTALTAYLTIGGNLLLGALTMAAYVGCVTVLGQALAWLIVGARQSRSGRRIVGALVTILFVCGLVVVQTGRLQDVVDSSPTERVVLAVIAGGAGNLPLWAVPTLVMCVATAISAWVGVRACAWATHRPSDAHAARSSAPRRRRAPRPTALRELVAVDRASAWRAPAVRRGGLVILLLPGAVAGTLHVPWESLIVLPGLVAAGAGLLYGVNAFALDASGSVWLASLPVSPQQRLQSKLIVVTETVLVGVVAAAAAGAVRSPTSPTAAQVSALLAASLACTVLVVALCLRSSVHRPHPADLRGPRDAVAPPGALAAASARLAFPCVVVGMILAASARADEVWLPPLIAVTVVLAATLSILRTARAWDEPVRRARVVHAVAGGA